MISCRLLIRAVLMLTFCCASVLSLRAQTPANDDCSGAVLIGSLPDTISQDTRLATPNPSDPVLYCADGGGGNTVWFKYVSDTTGYVTFTTRESSPVTYDI